MEETTKKEQPQADPKDGEVREVIRDAIQEYLTAEQRKAEPAYKAELVEERRRREELEKRVNQLVKENEHSRSIAEEAERHGAIREELQRLGVAKVDLGFRAVKDDIVRGADGQLVARTDQGNVGMKEYLARFASENPELLPARIPGGSGAPASGTRSYGGPPVELNRIKPGMDPEEMAKVRREIADVVSQSFGIE